MPSAISRRSCMVAKNSLLFLVNPKVPAKSLAEFVALAKADPGKFNYASPGAATQTHLVVELFSQQAGIKLQHIPYRGGAPAMTRRWSRATPSSPRSRRCCRCRISRAAALRAIASGSLTRDPQLPDLPTVAEQGFPGFEAIQWIGLLTTAGTPRPNHRAPQRRDQPRAARSGPDRQVRTAGHRAGRRHARGLSAHDRRLI